MASQKPSEQRNTEFDKRVLSFVCTQKGAENHVSRRTLIMLLFGIYVPENISPASLREDREIRRAIARLQKSYPIVSSSGEGGYFMAASFDEFLNYSAEVHSRAFKLLDKARNMKKVAELYFKMQSDPQTPLADGAK